MYCKHCGKKLADDSVYCQYCGKQIHDNVKPKTSVFSRFTSLSKGWQICIMIYILLLLGGICIIVIADKDRYFNEDVLFPLMLVLIVVPTFSVFVWYSITHLFKKTNESQTIKNSIYDRDAQMSTMRYSLQDFVKAFGKMQIRTVEVPEQNGVISYCTFTSSSGVVTKVYFDEKLGALRASEIVKRQEELYIMKNLSGEYELKENP